MNENNLDILTKCYIKCGNYVNRGRKGIQFQNSNTYFNDMEPNKWKMSSEQTKQAHLNKQNTHTKKKHYFVIVKHFWIRFLGDNKNKNWWNFQSLL